MSDERHEEGEKSKPKLTLTRRSNPDEASGVASTLKPEQREAVSRKEQRAGAGLVLKRDVLADNKAVVLACVAVGCLVVGSLLAWRTALVSLVLMLGLSSALWAGVRRWRERGVGTVPGIAMLAGASVLVLGLGLLWVLPKWHAQSVGYGERLVQLSGKATSKAAREADAQELGEKTGEAVQKAVAGARDVGAGLGRLVRRCNDWTGGVSARRGLVLGQVVLLLAGFVLLPLVRLGQEEEGEPVGGSTGLLPGAKAASKPPKKPPALAGLRGFLSEAYLKVSGKIGAWCWVRLVKALVLGVLVTLGFRLAGIPFALFIGGCAGALSLVTRMGHLLGLVLALPMVLFADKIWVALGSLAGAWLVLWLVEQKLHHWLVDRSLVIDRGRGGALRSLGTLVYVGRVLLSLAFFGALGYIGYKFVPKYYAEQNLAAKVAELEEKVEDDPEEALEVLRGLVEEHPYDSRVREGLVQALLESGDVETALEAAEEMAGLEDVPEPEGLLDRWYERTMEVVHPRPAPDPMAGYEQVLEHVVEESMGGEVLEPVVEAILEMEPEHEDALTARIEVIAATDPGGLQAYLDETREQLGDRVEWWVAQAVIYERKRMWREAHDAAKQAQEIELGHEGANRIRVKALRKLDLERGPDEVPGEGGEPGGME